MPTVLVVEYDHETRVRVRRALEDGGYSVVSRTDTRSALDALKESPTISLVVVNQELSGLEDFLSEKARTSAIASIPVISVVQPLDPGRLLEKVNERRQFFIRS